MADADTKSATSAKLDMLDAICRDPRVTPGEFKVAYCLAQRQGPKGICPSQEYVSIETGFKPRQVRSHIAKLVAKGWLRKSRRNRQLSNQYEFVTEHMEAVNDRFQSAKDNLMDKRKSRISDRQDRAAQEFPDGQNVAASDRQDRAAPDRQNIAANNLSGTPEGEHLNQGHDKKDIEIGVYAHARPETDHSAAARPVPPDTDRPGPASRFGSVDPIASLDALEFEMQERQRKARRREYQE